MGAAPRSAAHLPGGLGGPGRGSAAARARDELEAALSTGADDALGAESLADDFWSAEDTTPAEIEEALRSLMRTRREQDSAYAPARVCNLVCVIDAERRDEVQDWLERVGRYHPSRTILCLVEPGRDRLGAWATMACEVSRRPGELALCRERIEIEVGSGHLPHLDTIVKPILVRDLVTIIWSPHHHPEATDSLVGVSEVALVDSGDEPDVETALERVAELARAAYVVDLSWLRSTPWRERIAALFDPPEWRPALARIGWVTIRHRPDSTVAALLLAGWLASRLGWSAKLDGGELEVRLEPAHGLEAPGLAGITIGAPGDFTVSLDRGAGGLAVKLERAGGRRLEWTMLGASRGEGGILGEGVRQALLRDPTFLPALDAARAMAA